MRGEEPPVREADIGEEALAPFEEARGNERREEQGRGR